MRSRRGALLQLLAVCTVASSFAGPPQITTYGEPKAQAPKQLGEFSFLVGKWQGAGTTRLPNGSSVPFNDVTWIGRYVLDGTAIADEFHAATPDGKTYLGISLRQFEVQRRRGSSNTST